MAAFPTVTHTRNSARTPIPGIVADRGEDGLLRTRSMHQTTTWRFDLELLVYSSDRAGIYSHFASEGTDAFSYTWPDGSVAHTVRYVQEPYDQQQGDGTWWIMRVALEGVVT